MRVSVFFFHFHLLFQRNEIKIKSAQLHKDTYPHSVRSAVDRKQNQRRQRKKQNQTQQNRKINENIIK